MTGLQHLYLSPHFDDAALSCGGQIAQHTAAGRSALVFTVCGGAPDYAHLSSFAAEIHARAAAGRDPVATRRREDRQALARLGASLQFGPYPDAIYRWDERRARWPYSDEHTLFGDVSPSDEPLVAELVQAFTALAPAPAQAVLYAPLAVGNHVDHQIVRCAALLLRQAGYAVLFYEDYPYAARDEDAVPAALAGPERALWRPQPVPLSENSLQRKIEAIAAYRSQIGALFGDVAAMAAAVAAFAQQVAAETGVGQWAERLWRLEAA